MHFFAREHLLDQKLLLVFRAGVDAFATTLPAGVPMQPIRGQGLAGIWIERRQERPTALLPARLSATLNVVHFLYVTQDPPAGRDSAGVLVLRRDTSSRWQSWRTPGPALLRKHHARFRVRKWHESIEFSANSDDRVMHVALSAQLTQELPANSLFHSVADATASLRSGPAYFGAPCGVSHLARQKSTKWKLQPLAVKRVESSLFGLPANPNGGELEFDSAFTLQSIEFGWRKQPAFCCDAVTA